ncbi:MAG: AAA family ATPase [Candidatus Obscuribacter sp.]|nr:AAA family ATPase [Candidatus Obscuribacter sp.]
MKRQARLEGDDFSSIFNSTSGFHDGRRPWQLPQQNNLGRTRLSEEEPAEDDGRKTFADVAGCDEAIAKLKRVRKWLKRSKWYALFHAKIPKGILLYGPPGTGKTLLVKALAGETDANYFSMAASEFVEMFVGVGASRVRKLFDDAKEARRQNGKPSIIFIDELDAVGKSRSGMNMSGNSERDQTLNQLLTNMDGFEPSSGILVIAATNMPQSLDAALTRPGRFDYLVNVDYPDIDGREKIFAVHTRKFSLAPDVNLRELAVRTTNFAGAHIERVCNEAAVIAAERQEHLTLGLSDEQLVSLPHEVSRQDFDRSMDYVQFGDVLLSRMRSQTSADAWTTCIHEAGHAVVATATNGYPVTKITRIIHSRSLGMMQAHAVTERYSQTEAEFKGLIKTAFAGQAAQMHFLGFRDSGASSDLEQANRMARFMVGQYGMSELGPVQIRLDEQGFPAATLSDSLRAQFDDAWISIVQECWEEAYRLVESNSERILRIARVLMYEETILGDRFLKLYESDGGNDAGANVGSGS